MIISTKDKQYKSIYQGGFSIVCESTIENHFTVFTNLEDDSKKILSRLNGKHLPQIKFIGRQKVTHKTKHKFMNVFEIKKYKPASKETRKIINRINRLLRYYDIHDGFTKFKDVINILTEHHDQFDQTLIHAFIKIDNEISKTKKKYFYDGYQRPDNFAEDENGDLILLDIFL